MPQHNATFAVPPRDSASAFVPLGTEDLDAILCVEVERVVARDNTVSVETQVLQLAAQPGRRSCAGLQVTVRHHLDGRRSVMQGARVLGCFSAAGHPLDGPPVAAVPSLPRRLTRQDTTTIATEACL